MNVENLLNSDEKVFEKILKKLFMENISNSKKELEERYKFNNKLYKAIEFTLLKLKEEETIISRILYSSFGIGKKKNKRRKHLILLGTQLKIEINNLEKNIHRVDSYHKNSLSSTIALTRLSDEFGRKIHTIEEDELADKCNKYLRKIYIVTDEVNRSTRALDLKNIYLESSIDKYRTLLKKIPRYHELNNSKQLENKSK
jgi:hypothetical protein